MAIPDALVGKEVKIGDWQKTMEAERIFWTNWLETVVANPPPPTAEWQWKHEASLILEELGKQGIVLEADTRILEIGGGAIECVRWFPTGKLFSVDPLHSLFSEYRPKLGPAWHKLRQDVENLAPQVESLSIGLEKFNVILAVNCLDHCRDPGKGLKNITGLLSPNGVFFEATVVWHKPGSPGHTPVDAKGYGKGHPHLYRGDEWSTLVSGFGLVQVAFATEGFVSRWTQHWGKGAWPCYPRLWRLK